MCDNGAGTGAADKFVSGFYGFQNGAQRRKDWHIPDRCRCFGRTDTWGVVFEMQAVPNMKNAGVQIDIRPAQGERLAATKTGPEHDHGPDARGMLVPVCAHGGDLIRRKIAMRTGSGVIPDDVYTGIILYNAIGQRAAEDLPRGNADV